MFPMYLRTFITREFLLFSNRGVIEIPEPVRSAIFATSQLLETEANLGEGIATNVTETRVLRFAHLQNPRRLNTDLFRS